jgi:XapX domain-containing protein
MHMYIFSLCAGVMAGVVCSLIDVRSAAPPLVAVCTSHVFDMLPGRHTTEAKVSTPRSDRCP